MTYKELESRLYELKDALPERRYVFSPDSPPLQFIDWRGRLLKFSGAAAALILLAAVLFTLLPNLAGPPVAGTSGLAGPSSGGGAGESSSAFVDTSGEDSAPGTTQANSSGDATTQAAATTAGRRPGASVSSIPEATSTTVMMEKGSCLRYLPPVSGYPLTEMGVDMAVLPDGGFVAVFRDAPVKLGGQPASHLVWYDDEGVPVRTAAVENLDAYRITTDEEGGVLLCGDASDGVTLHRYGPNGIRQWSRTLGHEGYSVQSIALLKDGRAAVLHLDHQESRNHLEVVLLSPAGDTTGTVPLPDTNGELGGVLAASPDGGFAVTGDYGTGGSAPGFTHLVSQGGQDAYVAKFGADAAMQWVRSIGGSELDSGEAVTVDPSGSVFAVIYTDSSDGDLAGVTKRGMVTARAVCRFDAGGRRQYTALVCGAGPGIPLTRLFALGDGRVAVTGTLALTGSAPYPILPAGRGTANAYGFALELDGQGRVAWGRLFALMSTGLYPQTVRLPNGNLVFWGQGQEDEALLPDGFSFKDQAASWLCFYQKRLDS